MNLAKLSLFALIFLVLPTVQAINEVTLTTANGLVAYEELDSATPLFRIWNSTNFTVNPQGALSIGTNTTNDITWNIIKGNHERDEMILVTEDKGLDINVQVYQENATWGYLQELTTDAPNSAFRSFDVDYEDISGDALIVYESSSGVDSNVAYRIWNGTSYSTEQTLTTSLTAATVNWIDLISKPGTDTIMLLAHDNADSLYAIPWNGTAFDTTLEFIASTATTSSTEQHFDFAWEGSSGEGLLVLGTTNLQRSSFIEGSGFTSLIQIETTGNIDATRLCGDTNSDLIGIIWQDSGNDVSARMWTGTAIEGSPPTEDAQTEPSGANNANIDCAWINSTTSFFGYVDFNDVIINSFNYDTATGWSVTDITNSEPSLNAGDDIHSVRFIEHPTAGGIMGIGMDILEDIVMGEVDGVGERGLVAESPIETSTEVANGDQESVLFDWFKFDPPPNVTSIFVNQTSYEKDENIDFNVTILDNIAIELVQFNVTLPNGSSSILRTTTNTSASLYEGTFNTTDLDGNYTLQITANDTSIHQNINNTETTVFTVGDAVIPVPITFIQPPNSTAIFPGSSSVQIRINVTDETQVDSTLVNITLPNSSSSELVLTNLTNNNSTIPTVTFEANFTTTDLLGSYTILAIANDTANNINNTESITFSIGDSTLPLVFNLKPINDTNFDNFTQVEISANITDNLGIDFVYANITLPNETIIENLQLKNVSEADIYNATFNITDLSGNYNVSFFTNDTSNLINDTEKTNFSIGDIAIPSDIILNLPSDEFNTTFRTVDFNFTATDDLSATLSCDLTLNNVIESTILANNGTLTNTQLTNLVDNNYEWNVTCSDNYANENTSISRTLRIDTESPNFISLTTSPSTTDELDPGTNVTAVAEVNDTILSVDSVILEYKEGAAGTYQNLTLVKDSGDLFNATFNATNASTYFLRLHANDTIGNSNISSEINISVQSENSWTRSPSDFGVTTSSADENLTIGTLIINNTGDSALDFNITSDYDETYFNDSVNFNLETNSLYNLIVNASRSTTGTTNLELTINGSNGDSLTTTASLVVAPGQPVLVSRFLDPTEESITVTQGDVNLAFEAELNNTGGGNASNVTLSFGLPEEWPVTLGNTNLTFEEILSGEEERNNIEISIPSNFSAGTYKVTVNASGVNESGTDINSLGLSFGDLILVNVNAPTSTLGADSTGGSAESSSSAASAASGSAIGGSVFKSGSGETLFTTETLTIVRGNEEDTPIVISNLFENSILKNIQLSLQGFLSQYITIQPQDQIQRNVDVRLNLNKEKIFRIKGLSNHKATLNSLTNNSASITVQSEPLNLNLELSQPQKVDLDNNGELDTIITLKETNNSALVNFKEIINSNYNNQLNFGESANYTLNIFAPAYLDQETYNLTIKITGDITALDPNAAGFTTKPLTELREVTLVIKTVTKEQLQSLLDEAFDNIILMQEANFPTSKVQELLKQAKQAFNEGNLELSNSLVNQIATIKSNAFQTDALIQEVQGKINKVNSRFLNIPETEKTLALAIQAFEREDFNLALERAKEAQLTYLLETKGTINFILFLTTYWWAVIITTLASLVILNLIYRRLSVEIINQRIKNINKEEQSLANLAKELQIKAFKKKEMSILEYKKSIKDIEKRLDKIRTIRVRLRNKKSNIIQTEKQVRSLEKEYQEVLELLRQAQIKYFTKKTISKSTYHREEEIDKGRLGEIEEQKYALKEKLTKEKDTKKYKFLNLISKITDLLEKLFNKKSKYVNYKLDKSLATLLLLDKFDLNLEVKKPVKEEVKKESKKLTLKELKTFFPIAARDIEKLSTPIEKPLEEKIKTELKIIDNKKSEKNISKSMNLIFNNKEKEITKNIEAIFNNKNNIEEKIKNGMNLLFNKDNIEEKIQQGMHLLFNKKENIAESLRRMFK